MPTRPCPHCQKTAPRYLPASSDGAVVNYYRCDGCGHVFHVAKGKPEADPVPVTMRPPSSDPDSGEGGGSSATS
jgi:hypothetical protein